MPSDPSPDRDPAEDDAGDGRVDSDDTTQADAGMAGGTGASVGEGTTQPQGTDPHADDTRD